MDCMFLSKESRQSAQVFGHALKMPLYDADLSAKARELLASGDVEGAIAEWRRLAGLGSGRARSVLAYVALMGTSFSPSDLEEARRLAVSALQSERGYANYVLGCIALKENQVVNASKYLLESHKAGFVPAATLLASLLFRARDAAPKAIQSAVTMLRRANAAGHRPALMFLCRLYLSGRAGLAHRVLGLLLLPAAAVRYLWAAKYQVFAIGSFHYTRRTGPLLVSGPLQNVRAGEGALGARSYLSVISVAHFAAAILAAAVLFSQPGRASLNWMVLAMWPYGVSYWIASMNNARSLIGSVVQTLLLTLITALVCSAYVGELLDFALSGWMIGAITVAQAVSLVFAAGMGLTAAKQVEPTGEPGPPYRRPILFAQILLGLIAAGSVFARPNHWGLYSLSHYGFDIAADVLLALLPYGAAALFAWRMVTTSPWRPWVYLGVVVVGTLLAVVNNCGLAAVEPGYLSVGFIVCAQSALFGYTAERTLDGDEW
jgi:hypothetical protein